MDLGKENFFVSLNAPMKNNHIALIIPYRIAKSLDSYSLWFQVRRENGPLNNLLEWPGGKIEMGEPPEAAAKRELAEELPDFDWNWSKQRLLLFNQYSYEYPDRHLHFSVYLLKADDISLEIGGWKDILLAAKPLEMQLALPDANRVMIQELHHYFRQQLEGGIRPWAL
jgi:mutator protein MutT